MRICVVGCGAVGSLFAANLATLDDVEVWAFDLYQAHVDAINADGLRLSGPARSPGGLTRRATRARPAPCDFGIVATKAMHAGSAIAATAHAFADGGAVASVMNGVGQRRDARPACRPASSAERRSRPARCSSPVHVQWDVKGDTTFSPFEPAPGRPWREVEPLADACTRGGMPAQAVGDARPAAVAEGHLQRVHEPDRRPDRADARPRLRAARPARARHRARRRGQGGRGRAGDHARRGSRGADRPRCEARTSRTATRPRCSRTSRPAGRPRSTSSTAASPASAASSACRPRRTTPSPHSIKGVEASWT